LVANLFYVYLPQEHDFIITLHARKVTIEEQKQLETTQVTLSYKTTVVLNNPFPRYLNHRGIWERVAQKRG